MRHHRLQPSQCFALIKHPLVRSSSELVVHCIPENGNSNQQRSNRCFHPSSHHTTFNTKTDIPNPQSQSLSRGYGSILPTSLIYIVLSTRGCTPWRPEAVMSTTRGANKSRHWVFTGRRKRTGQCKKYTAFPESKPYRRSIRFQGLRSC